MMTQQLPIFQQSDWWGGSVRGLRQLRKLAPGRFVYLDRVVADWHERTVLDLGCGGGFMAEALARRGARVIGVDPSAGAVAAATAHARDAGLAIDYRVAPGERLDLADGCVDIVVCVDVLEHVEDLDRTMGEIHRVLKPGGLFVFNTVNRTALAAFVAVTMAERVLRILPRGTHDPRLFITPQEMAAKLAALGFAVSSFEGFGPRGLDRDLDFTFGRLPTLAVGFIGHARRG